jgi:hypothetical protein
MGARGFQQDIVENWAVGVITAVLADRLPDGAVPVSKNSQFYNLGPQTAIFGTRKGCQVQNTTAEPDAIISQYFLNAASSNVHLVVNGDGDLGSLSGGVVTSIDAALFTNVANQFSWQTADNLAFVVNGTDKFKTDGTTVWAFGIQQPNDAHWSIAASGGGSNLPAGDYNVVIAYYNSDTGHTGPESAHKSVTIAAGQQITVTLPTALQINDAQVDFVKIFIEQADVKNEFYLAVAGTTPAITATNGWAVGTVSVAFDATQTEISAFRILSPDVNNNYPPPSGTKYLANHRSRMFAATNSAIYWSAVDAPESFNTTDHTLPVGEEDGENITGLAVLSDSLIIFKRNAIYALVGEAPENWEIVLVDKTVGCVSYSSIGYFNNTLFWMSLRGPQMWAGVDSGIVDITTELIGPNFDESHVDPDSLEDSIIIGHPVQNYVAWAITPADGTRNTVIIPFNFKLNRWMASEWNIVDVRSCTLVADSDGREWPMLGDYDGWIYKLGVSDADGLPSGVAASGFLTGATTTTLTDTSLALTTNKLIGRYVYTWNDTTGVRNAQRRRIASNTATVITVATAWSSLPQVGDHYAIGGILLDWHSAFRHGGVPFFKKRIEFLFLEVNSSSTGVSCDVEVYKDLDNSHPILSRTLTVGVGDLWDVGIWDTAMWAAEGSGRFRIPIRNVGYNWQTRVIHMSTGEQLYIYRNAVQWQTKTKKTGRGTRGS